MGNPYLELTKTDKRFFDDTFQCVLKLFDQQKKLVASWIVASGQGYAQNFRKAGYNMPGSMEPCPQGLYRVEDIAWAGGKDNWDISWGDGLGPAFVPIICSEEKRRGEFGIHVDYNRSRAPGSAGCVVMTTIEDMKNLIQFLRKYDPRELYVRWGL